MFPKLSQFVLAGVLSAGLLGAGTAAAPAQAKTINACIKKKTGEVKILSGSKKKCKKGWKKASWNKQGPQGKTGPKGPQLMVRDATGKVLGTSVGTIAEGITLLFVEIDGGFYSYLPNGLLISVGGSSSPSYKNNTCTGTPYLELGTSPTSISLYTGAANGPSRYVYRRTVPDFGPASAWSFGSTIEDVAAVDLYHLDSSGACVLDSAAYTGKLGVMQAVTAPPDVPGPLTVG